VCMAALNVVIPPDQQGKKVPKTQKKGWARMMSSKKLAQGIHHVFLSLKKDFGSAAKTADMKKRRAEDKLKTKEERKLSRSDKKAKGVTKKMAKLTVAREAAESMEVEAILGAGNEESDAEDSDTESDARHSDEDNDVEPAADKMMAEGVQLPDGGSDAPVDDWEDDDGEDDQEESTFLPSLNTGFIAGSDSEFDEEAEDVDGTERKNRRGQRARKAIWEKKYGKNANHIKKQREAMPAAFPTAERGGFGRGRGRGEGATRSRGRSGYKPGRGGFDSRNASKVNRGRAVDGGWAGRAGHTSSGARPAPQEPPKAAATEKPMHPSWQAKKQEKNTGQLVAAQGKKIVFGE